jgi:RNA polymerase-binding transcription factor DksA
MFVMDEERLIILGQEHECLYNLQHKDYGNNLVKDNCWKEIAGELQAQDKELSRRTQHCRRIAGERYGICESSLTLRLPNLFLNFSTPYM